MTWKKLPISFSSPTNSANPPKQILQGIGPSALGWHDGKQESGAGAVGKTAAKNVLPFHNKFEGVEHPEASKASRMRHPPALNPQTLVGFRKK